MLDVSQIEATERRNQARTTERSWAGTTKSWQFRRRWAQRRHAKRDRHGQCERSIGGCERQGLNARHFVGQPSRALASFVLRPSLD